MASKPRTLYEKIWDAHVIERRDDGTCLIFIDRHLVHEVTSPQAFEALRAERAQGAPARPDAGGARPQPADHAARRRRRQPRADRRPGKRAAARRARAQRARVRRALLRRDRRASRASSTSSAPSRASRCPARRSSAATAIPPRTAALGALAFGIGTSEVEHVLATQTLLLQPSKTMEVRVEGELGPGITSKDLILHIIGAIGTAGGTGHVIEYRGKVFEEMSVEGRLTVCNMSIEGGARAGLIAPDETTFAYLKGRPLAPKGEEWDQAVAYWRTLHTDPGATFDKSVVIDAADDRADRDLGHQPRGYRADRRRGARSGELRRSLASRRPRAPASTTWASSPASGWTEVEVAERLHRQLHQQPHRGPARRRRGAARAATRRRASSGRSSSPARAWSRRRPRPRGSTRCSPKPASNGASRAARRASA